MSGSGPTGTSDGSVWKGWFTHVPADNRGDYYRFMSKVHRYDLDAAKKAGLIEDWKIVTSRYRSPNDWNLAILMKYENLGAMDVDESEFHSIEEASRAERREADPDVAELLLHKDEWRVSLAQRVFREMDFD